MYNTHGKDDKSKATGDLECAPSKKNFSYLGIQHRLIKDVCWMIFFYRKLFHIMSGEQILLDLFLFYLYIGGAQFFQKIWLDVRVGMEELKLLTKGILFYGFFPSYPWEDICLLIFLLLTYKQQTNV